MLNLRWDKNGSVETWTLYEGGGDRVNEVARVYEKKDAKRLQAAANCHEALTASLAELVEICRHKCGPHDEVVLESGRTNHQALCDEMAVLERIKRS